MTVLPITIWGEPVLHRRASEVETFDDELRTLIADMFETNEAANGVGLAAPQVGVGKRIFVFKYANDDDAPDEGVVVNPVLTLSKVSGASRSRRTCGRLPVVSRRALSLAAGRLGTGPRLRRPRQAA